MLKLMNKSGSKLIIPLVIGGVLLLLLPLIAGPYYTHVGILIFLNIMLVLGYRLLFVTGLVSLCHITFYAIGGYTSAVLAVKFGLPPVIGFLAGGAVAALASTILILPAARVRGPYFFLISFAFWGVADSVFKHWKGVTGGQSGITGIPAIMGFESMTPYYYLILAFAAFTVFIMYRIHRSRFGIELTAIGDDDGLAEVSGINVLKHRTIAFAIGALFAGFAGSFYAHYESFICPTSFSMWSAIYVLIWCVVGGARKFWGPIVGAIAMTLVAELMRMVGTTQAIFYAVALLIIIMALPQGISGLVDTLRARFAGAGIWRQRRN